MITGNLTQLPEQDTKRVLAERTATYWLHQKRKGCMSREDIVKRLNAIHKEDSMVWDGQVTKLWGDTGKILIKTLPPGMGANEYLQHLLGDIEI